MTGGEVVAQTYAQCEYAVFSVLHQLSLLLKDSGAEVLFSTPTDDCPLQSSSKVSKCESYAWFSKCFLQVITF